jgi:hypothetical protein
MLDQRQHPIRHEPGGPNSRPAARHLRDLDDPATRPHLDAASGTSRHHLIRPRVAARIDDDLDAVTFHPFIVTRVSRNRRRRRSADGPVEFHSLGTPEEKLSKIVPEYTVVYPEPTDEDPDFEEVRL